MEAREQPYLKEGGGCHCIGVGTIRQHRVEVTNNSGPQHGVQANDGLSVLVGDSTHQLRQLGITARHMPQYRVAPLSAT